MKLIIKRGFFLNKDNNEKLTEFSGKLKDIAFTETGDGTKTISLTFKPQEGEDIVLEFKRFGDSAMKILRCLHADLATLGDDILTFREEAREGLSSIIHICAGERELLPMFAVPDYGVEKNHLIIYLAGLVKKAVGGAYPVLAVGGVDGLDGSPEDFARIAAAKAAGTLKSAKRTFSFTEQRDVFCDAMREAGWYLYLSGEAIALAEEVVNAEVAESAEDAEEC